MTAQERNRKQERALRLHNRAAQHHSEGEPVRPEKLYLQALRLKEELFGSAHPEVAVTAGNLALFYKSLGRLVEARRLYERALLIFQRNFGASHDSVGMMLFNLAQLLKAEAEAMEQRARRVEQDAKEMADPEVLAQAVIRQDFARYRLSMRPSRVHRFGVFAEEPIPTAEKVIEYTGERVNRLEAVRRCRNGRTYLYRLNSYWSVDGSAGGSGAELINHCCEPNCRFHKEDGKVWIVSLRNIAAGEELLLDYKFPKSCELVPCYCGAANCRGTINLC
jgi:tetratricopeptide (TPR) repeat protein